MSTENANKGATAEVPQTTTDSNKTSHPYASSQELQKHSLFTKTEADLPYLQINKRAQELDIYKVPRKWVVS